MTLKATLTSLVTSVVFALFVSCRGERLSHETISASSNAPTVTLSGTAESTDTTARKIGTYDNLTTFTLTGRLEEVYEPSPLGLNPVPECYHQRLIFSVISLGSPNRFGFTAYSRLAVDKEYSSPTLAYDSKHVGEKFLIQGRMILSHHGWSFIADRLESVDP